jgi:hypothetical protein
VSNMKPARLDGLYSSMSEKYAVFINELKLRGCEPDPNEHIGNLKYGKHQAALVASIVAVLDKLPTIQERLKFSLMLAGTNTPYNPESVLKLFSQLDNDWQKDSIISVLTQSCPMNIEDWFIKQLTSSDSRFINESVANYIGYSSEYVSCRDILMDNYSDFPLGALNSFMNAGSEVELEFIKKFNHSSIMFVDPVKANTYSKLLPKAIKKLESRVKRANMKHNKNYSH